MTRINLIPVAELSDQHLIREYNELPRCIKQDINTDDAPRIYKLGGGHMKWGKKHSTFLLNRYMQLCDEMIYRGFKVNYPYLNLYEYYESTVEDKNKNWYDVSSEDIELSRDRIIEKIEKKFDWYRWTNRDEPYYVLAMKLDMGVH